MHQVEQGTSTPKLSNGFGTPKKARRKGRRDRKAVVELNT
jgi:hypothetical protein